MKQTISVHPKDTGLKFQRSIRKKRPQRKAAVPETTIQSLTEQYLHLKNLYFIHIKNAVYRTIFANPSVSIQDKRAAKEAIAGIPDLVIMHEGCYLALELKTEIGKLSQRQRLVQQQIGTLVPRSFEEAKGYIDRFLDGKGFVTTFSTAPEFREKI